MKNNYSGNFVLRSLSKKGFVMQNYTFEEMADMHVMYARAYSNCYAARRLYAEAFPHRRLPDSKTFESVDRRLREKGKFSYFFFEIIFDNNVL